MGMNRSRKSVARVVARSIVPPRSLIECVSYNRRTGAYRSDVGRQYRVGYYGACRDGSDVVWLVDERGKYVATTSHEDLKKYFKIIRRSRRYVRCVRENRSWETKGQADFFSQRSSEANKLFLLVALLFHPQ